MMRFRHFVLIPLFVAIPSFSQFGFDRKFDVPVTESSALTMPWSGGLNFCQFSNIDLDFDGKKDLFVFDRSGDKVLTFLQKGATGVIDYEYAPEFEDIFPEDLVSWVFLRDYNCDGLEDIFAYTIGGIKVYLNTGSVSDGHQFELVSPLLQRTYDGTSGYIYSNSIDIPSIIDVDNDGDLDIFQFGPLGTAVEYHKNMSVEYYGDCDTLLYEAKNDCWGRFRETGSPTSVALNDTTEYPCNGLLSDPEYPLSGSGDRDGGKALMLIDLNDNGVMDLILSHQGGPWLISLYNDGTAPNMNSSMYQQFPYYPQETDSLCLYSQPAAFYVDINNDEKRDLVVSPARKIESNNYESAWYYTNTNSDSEPVFDHQGTNFLQGQMIDNGSNAYPVFFDANGDGLKDLLISCLSRYTNPTTTEKSRIMYYENVGTSTAPEFELVTDDYEDISTMGIGSSREFYPTFADLDNDGDKDMIMGEYEGYCYYAENTGGAGNPAEFNTFIELEDNTATLIFDGQLTFPNLVDIDRDNDYDLVIGRRNGKLRYFENVGDASSFEFELKTNEFGNVDVSEYWSTQGLAVPRFLDIDGEYHLVVGSKTGDLHYFTDIGGNLDGTFTLVDSTLDNLNIGTECAPAINDIDADGKYEMVLGTLRGGVGLFESTDSTLIGIENTIETPGILIYPVPAKDRLYIRWLDKFEAKDDVRITLLNMQGKKVYGRQISGKKESIDIHNFESGSYILYLESENFTVQKKIIIQ